GKAKKDDKAEEVIQESERLPSPKKIETVPDEGEIMDLGDDESEEKEQGNPEENIPEESSVKEDQLKKPVSESIETSTKEAPTTQTETSVLEVVVVQTLSVMSASALGPIAPSTSSSSFSWVQPLLESKKRKSTSIIVAPKFDAVETLLGTTPPPPAKKAKVTSRLVSDSQGQQFMEIARPKLDKDEKDLSMGDLELTRISLGESTPESEVHNLRETMSKVIERVEKGKSTQEQLEEQNQILSSFIKSLLAEDKVLDPTPLASIPPPAILSNDEVQAIKDIHKHATYGKAMEAMVDELIITGFNFIEEAFKAYEKIAKIQLKFTTTLSGLDRELKLWSECIQDLRLMSETDVQILLENK
ncbi:hypothetical protein KI387_043552, partial [Taxus chinensis]